MNREQTDVQSAPPAVRAAMKIGVVVPTWDGSFSGKPAWSDIISYAQAAEEVGFDALWVGDELTYHFENGEKMGMWECWSVLSALAACTKRVKLGSLVSCNPFRHPTLLAKIAATVDTISDGRLILGLGSGSNQPQHAAFGYPADNQYSRFEESLIIIRSLLRTGYADFTGKFYQVHDCDLNPWGPRPHIPLLIGTEIPGPRMARLVAQYADMWNGLLVLLADGPEDIPPLRKTLDAACKLVSRDPATLQRTAAICVNMSGELMMAGTWDLTPASLKGSPEHIVQTLLAFEQEGISHLQVYITPETQAGLEAFAPVLTLLNKERERLASTAIAR